MVCLKDQYFHRPILVVNVNAFLCCLDNIFCVFADKYDLFVSGWISVTAH